MRLLLSHGCKGAIAWSLSRLSSTLLGLSSQSHQPGPDHVSSDDLVTA